MALNIIDHPVAKHLLTVLRDRDTSSSRFREICKQLSYFLLIEATRSMKTEPRDILTPLAPCEGTRIKGDLAAVPILRSGMTMLPAVFDLFENIAVGYIGLQRDEKTERPHSYCCKLPNLKNRHVFVLDPMVATGGSAAGAIEMILEREPASVAMLSIIVAPEGARNLEKSFQDIPIFSIAIDERLNDRRFIVPGVGDFGDRAYGADFQ